MSDAPKGFLSRRVKISTGTTGGDLEVDVPRGEEISGDMVGISRRRYDQLRASAVGETLTRERLDAIHNSVYASWLRVSGMTPEETAQRLRGMEDFEEALLASVSPTPCPTNHGMKVQTFSTIPGKQEPIQYNTRFCMDCGTELS